jgi:DNA polymerase-4
MRETSYGYDIAAMTLRSLFVDFDSYFASVEQHERPELRGRPVAVAPVDAETTCCIAASYEAKAFGVATGTLVRDARRLCPGIVVVLARPALYVQWHHRLLEAIDHAIPPGHVGSIDEVACDLVGRQCRRDIAEQVARQVKAEIARVAPGGALHCSIGIAPNAFLAKTASDMRKPDGLVVIEQADLPQALHGLELRDLCGIGPSMERRLHAHGIRSVAQLTAAPKLVLRRAWGSIEGERYWSLLRGEWLPPLPTTRGSVGHSHVLGPELRTTRGAQSVLKKLLAKAAVRLRQFDMLSGGMAVRIRFVGADERWESDLAFDHTDDSRELLHLLDGALAGCRELACTGAARSVPLSVSVTLHRLVERAQSTGSLFDAPHTQRKVDAVVDRINAKYGSNRVYFGSMQTALVREAAPMRIPFSHVPDLGSEGDPLWLQAFNRAKVMGEHAHRQRKQRG